MPFKFLIPLLFLSQFVLADDIEDKLIFFDQQRAAQNKATSEQLANLNFLRMKILAIRKDAGELTETANEITKICSEKSNFSKVETCHGRLNAAIQNAEAKQFELDQLVLSSHYQEIRQKSSEHLLGIDRLIGDARNSYTHFIDAARPLRRETGLRIAQLNFEKKIADADKKAEEGKRQVECRLAPINIRREILAADMLPMKAESESDAFLIYKAEHDLQRATDRLGSLKKLCPEQKSTLDEIANKADAKLKSLPGQGKRQELAHKACVKLNADLDPELKLACKDPILNSAVMFSLHRELERKAKK